LITDGNGCTARDTANVAIQSGLTVDLGPDQNVCQPSTVVVKASGYTAATHTMAWSTGASIDSVIVSSTSTIYIDVTDAQGCTGSDTVVITAAAKPNITIADQAICAGDSPVTFDVGYAFTTYQWSGNSSSTNQTATGSTAGTYSVIVTDGNGCKDTTSANLTVNVLPSVSFVDKSMCAGSISTFDAGSGYTYLWQDASANQTYGSTVAEQVHVLITDGNGCTARDTAIVTIQSGLTVDLGVDQSACDGNTFALNSGFDASSNTILWSTGASSANIVVSTTSNVTVEITDAGGCKGYDTVQVTLNPNPSISLSDQAICAGAPAASFDVGAGTGWSYAWSGDVTVGSALTNRNYSSNTAGTFNCTVTDGNSCTGSASAILTVNALPFVDIGDTVKLCPGGNTTFSSSAVFTSYEWNGNSANNQNSYTTNALGDVWLVVTDGNGCTDIDSSYLFHYIAPVVDVGADEAICIGQSITVSSGYGSGSGYANTWNTGETDESIMVTPLSTQTVYVYVGNGAGCPGYDEKIITVNALPVVRVDDQAICTGASDAIFTAVSDSAVASHSWSGNGTGTDATTTGGTAGNYTVLVIDENGCEGFQTGALTVHDLPTPSMGDNRMCFGATPVNFTPGSSYSSYVWSGVPAGQTSSSIMDSTAGDYIVEVTDVNGCKATATATLTVNSNPIIDVGDDLMICEGESVEVGDASYTGITETLLWNVSSSNQYLILNSSGTYVLTVTDENGCYGIDSMLLTVNLIPTYTKSADTVVCFETTGDLALAVETGTRNDILWELGGTSQEIAVTENGDYVFTIVTPSTLCEITDTIIVAEKCTSTIFIPNAFSPNGDGTNDYFYAQGINIKDFDFFIFNRWGEEIFHSDDIHKGWDGLYKDIPVQIDVYVWKMYYSTEEDHGGRKKRTRTGTVTVVK
ncbi:MAG: gliding motility-associated-like protein, partial [Saprospiraceae bacterium]